MLPQAVAQSLASCQYIGARETKRTKTKTGSHYSQTFQPASAASASHLTAHLNIAQRPQKQPTLSDRVRAESLQSVQSSNHSLIQSSIIQSSNRPSFLFLFFQSVQPSNQSIHLGSGAPGPTAAPPGDPPKPPQNTSHHAIIQSSSHPIIQSIFIFPANQHTAAYGFFMTMRYMGEKMPRS
jgi:hypothetical protein